MGGNYEHKARTMEEEAIFRVGTWKGIRRRRRPAVILLTQSLEEAKHKSDKKERNARRGREERELMWFHMWGRANVMRDERNLRLLRSLL